MEQKNIESNNHSVENKLQIREKPTETHKEEYDQPKMTNNSIFQEVEKAKTSTKQPIAIDSNSGYAMLVTLNNNFIMDKPICYIGKKWDQDKLAKDDACFLWIDPSFANKSISRITAKIFYSSKLGEYWIESIGKNAILVDRRSLKRSGGSVNNFLPLRNEACIQISNVTIFFMLPKEILMKKKLLRECRKSLLYDKLSKLSQKTLGNKQGKDDLLIGLKTNSCDIYQDVPRITMKDLILLYKNNQQGIDLPKSLQDKYFVNKKEISKEIPDFSSMANDKFISIKNDF